MLLSVEDGDMTPLRKCWQGFIRHMLRLVPLQTQYHLIQVRCEVNHVHKVLGIADLGN